MSNGILKKFRVLTVVFVIGLLSVLVFSCGGSSEGDDNNTNDGGANSTPQTYDAGGDYTYDSNTGVLAANFTSSEFPGCGPEIGTETFDVASITAIKMVWYEGTEDEMTWTRASGTAGDITGTWDFVDEDGNAWELNLDPDGSMVVIGEIVDCDDDGNDAAISDFTVPSANISIDGSKDDWASLQPVFTDAANDEDQDADFVGTDLDKLYLAKDDTFLYLMVTLNDGAPNQGAQYALELVPNAGGSGVAGDYLALVSYRDGSWSSAVHVREASNLNVRYSEEYVGIGDDFIEWKVELSDMQFFSNRYVWFYIHDFTPIFYPVSDSKKTGIMLDID